MKKIYFFATKMFAAFLMTGFLASLMLSSCKKYDSDIDGLQNQINQIASDINDLKAKVGENPVKAISFDEATGKLTVTTSSGTVNYTVKTPALDIKLLDNKLYVNGEEKGSVTFPESSVVTVGADGYLYINGVKTGITSPQEVTGKAEVRADGFLYIDGEKTNISVPPVVEVREGALYINGVKQALAVEFPADVIVFNKDEKDNIISVTLNQNGESYTIVSGTTTFSLAGLAFIPEMIVDGVNAVDFGYIVRFNPDPAADPDTVMVSTVKADFRLNPTQADVSNVTWKFLNRTSVIKTRAAGDNYDLISGLKSTVKDGVISFELGLNKEARMENAANDLYDIFALEATLPAEEETTSKVVSDYVQVLVSEYYPFIGDKVKYNAADAPKRIYDHDLDTTKAPVLAWNGSAPQVAANHKMVYGSTFDLMDYVMASANKNGYEAINNPTRKFFEDLNFNDYTYRFSKVAYKGPDNTTEQSYFVTLEGSKVTVTQGTAAIGRFPVFKVELIHNNKVVSHAYIKFEITATPPAGDQVYNVAAKTFEYNQLYADPATIQTNDIVISWTEMNMLYAQMGLSHTQFQNIYGAAVPTATYSSRITAADVEFVRSPNQPNVDTYAMYLRVKPSTKFGTHQVIYTFEPANNAKLQIVFTIIVKAPQAPVLSTIYAPNGVAQTKGKLVTNVYQMQMSLNEAFVNYMADYNNQFGTTAGKINNANHLFAFAFPTANSLAIPVLETDGLVGAVAPHAEIFEQPVSGGYMKQEIKMKAPLTADSKIYDVVFRTVFENNEQIEVPFKVQFNNPFSITLNPMAMATQTTPTLLDIKEYVTIKLNEQPLYDYSKKGTTGYDANGYHTANCTSYGIATNGSAITYTLNTTAVTGGNLTIAGSVLTWDNQGADLFDNITSETVTAKVTTAYAERTSAKTVVTLQKNR